MEKSTLQEFPISFQATGVITNPWYELPAKSRVNNSGEFEEITPPCRIEIDALELILLFKDNSIIFLNKSKSKNLNYLYNPIRYFLAYKTFINYNLVSYVPHKIDLGDFCRVNSVVFKVQKCVESKTIKKRNRSFDDNGCETIEKVLLDVDADSIIQYLKILNQTLYYAIAYYLVGCENERYFLIEYYKSVEVIRNSFRSKKEFINSLYPHCLDNNAYEKFGKICNDKILNPLNIGRHAPWPNATLYSIDIRHMLRDLFSYEIFEFSTVFCRQVIDAYIKFLACVGS